MARYHFKMFKVDSILLTALLNALKTLHIYIIKCFLNYQSCIFWNDFKLVHSKNWSWRGKSWLSLWGEVHCQLFSNSSSSVIRRDLTHPYLHTCAVTHSLSHALKTDSVHAESILSLRIRLCLLTASSSSAFKVS